MLPGMKSFRWALGAAVLTAVVWQSRTEATVVRAVPLGDLVDMSEWVVVAKVKTSRSHYETIGGSRRMVTDTVLEVEQALTPNRSSHGVESSTVTVRTLGGTIGDLAQLVPGEAVLTKGSTQVLFLDEARGDAVYRVSGMAQGQYPIRVDEKGNRVLDHSPGLDVVVNPQQSAVAALTGRSVEQAQSLVTKVRKIP
jgi:hypothetical protein